MGAFERNQAARKLLDYFYKGYEEVGSTMFSFSPQEPGVLENLGWTWREYEPAMQRLIQKGILEPFTLGGGARLTDYGVEVAEDEGLLAAELPTREEDRMSGGDPLMPLFVQGDFVGGSQTHTTINGSVVGAVASGPRASATGAVHQNTQDRLRQDVGLVQQAVIHEQDKLDAIHDLLFETMGQLLRSVRKMEFEQADQARVISQIKSSADDLWVKSELEGMQLPAGSEVAKAILASPVLAAALKAFIA